MLFTSKFSSPIGSLRFISTEANLKQIILPTQSLSSRLSHDLESKEIPILVQCAEQLEEYFIGKRKVFSLPLEPEGTSFQVKAWKALCTIKYGETATYGQQAKVVGVPNGARAVGSANALNPLPIILPCHRVLGSDGKLRGYAGGSDLLYIKEYLIKHERADPQFIA